jgi:hypothetical protein
VVHQAAAAKLVQHFQASAMQPGLHGAHRSADYVGDCLVAVSVFMEQDKDLTVLGSQGIDGSTDRHLDFARVVGVSVIGCLLKVLG